MNTVPSRDGTPLAYEASGSGPPLVLVNGALSDRRTVAPLRALLDPHFTVVAYDRRGRGGSGDSADPRGYAPEREVEDLAAVIDAVGPPAFVFGHSSGGLIALRAATGGVAMRRLAVNEPPFVGHRLPSPPPAEVTSRLQNLVAAGDREGALRTFLGEQVGLPAPVLESMKDSPNWPTMLALAHTTPYDAVLSATTSLPSAESLAGMKTRTLVLYGGVSFPWMAATSRILSQNLPNADLVLLEGQPHSPASQALAPALLRFFLAE